MTTQPEIVPVETLTEIVKTEIDIQIATAKRYPRSLEKFRQDALSMATVDKDIAASCFYKLKRNNANGESAFIEGPSVRLAEIVANAWGNLRFGARISNEGEREVTAQGVAHDLEKNVCNTIEVSRRITNRAGKRYGDDMIGVTKNAACSIALRNAIFKTVPFTYVKFIYEQAKKTAVGDAKTLAERRQVMFEQFSKMGVTKDQVIAFLEKKSFEDVGIAEIETMIGVYNAIKDGDTTIDEQFNIKNIQMPRPKTAQEATQTAETAHGGPVKTPNASETVQNQEAGAIKDEVKPEEKPCPDGFTLLPAVADGVCRGCKGPIKQGAEICFSKQKGIFHFDCAS